MSTTIDSTGHETIVNRPAGPGKFEGEGTVGQWVYERVMDEWGGEELGDSETFGHYDLLILGDSVTVQDDHDTWSFVAAIMSEDSQGFIHVDYFDTVDEARAVWAEIEQEYAAYEAEI